MNRLIIAVFLIVTMASPAAAQTAPDAFAWSAQQCETLKSVARRATFEGLPIRHDLLAAVDAAAGSSQTATWQAACDALFQAIVQDFASGRLAPQRVDPTWHLTGQAPSADSLRPAALAGADLTAVLNALLPSDPDYAALRARLSVLNAQPDLSRAEREEAAALRASMERLRWAPRHWPARYLLVDIAFFDVRLIENGQELGRWNTITGKRRTPTPSFSAEMDAVILNPDWTPPSGILRGEILPMARRDPEKANSLGYRAIRDSGEIFEPDWTERPFPYRVVQLPGPANALGRIKFDMPNPYAIFLHDTPQPALFAQSVRAFSHGCVRVEYPQTLAMTLLSWPQDWRVSLENLANSGERIRLSLSQPVTVIAIYRTARPGADGSIEWVPDIYRSDRRINEALSKSGGEDRRSPGSIG